jgi:hypothetical protein
MARTIALVNPWPNRNPGKASTKAKPLFKEIKMAKSKTKKAAPKKAARPAPRKAARKSAARKASTVATYGRKVRPVGYIKGQTLTLAPHGKKYSHASGITVKNPKRKKRVHRNPGPVKALTNKDTLITIAALGAGYGLTNWISNKIATSAFVAGRPWALRFKGFVMVALSALVVSRTKKDGAARSAAYGVGVSGLADLFYQNMAQARQFILPSMILPVQPTTAGADFERSTPRGAFLGTPISRGPRGLGLGADDSMRGGGDV